MTLQVYLGKSTLCAMLSTVEDLLYCGPDSLKKKKKNHWNIIGYKVSSTNQLYILKEII